MEEHILSDKDQYPTEEVIYSHIGDAKNFWVSIFAYIKSHHPDFNPEWKYYNDGKCWLLKITRKAKTIFWLSVLKESFRITFYFGDKAEPAILASSISDTLKNQFKNSKRYNKIRGITLNISSDNDIEDVKSLVAIKLSIK